MGFDFSCFPAKIMSQGIYMRMMDEEPLGFGLAVFAVTTISFAQWSNPADDVPLSSSAPLKVSALARFSPGAS